MNTKYGYLLSKYYQNSTETGQRINEVHLSVYSRGIYSFIYLFIYI